MLAIATYDEYFLLIHAKTRDTSSASSLRKLFITNNSMI